MSSFLTVFTIILPLFWLPEAQAHLPRHEWLQRLERLSISIQSGKISIPESRNALLEIFAQAGPREIERSLGLSDRKSTLTQRPLGVRSRAINLGHNFSASLLILSPGAIVPPHSHDGIVTLSYVLRGSVRVESFDRIFDATDHAILAPANDRLLSRGKSSAITDRQGNVHFFIAGKKPVYMLGIKIVQNAGAAAAAKDSERSYLDLVHSEKTTGGKIRARRISQAEAVKLYFGTTQI